MADTESLPKKKSTVLAEQNNWSHTYADGYVDGQYRRRRGEPLGAYLTVGLDEYAQGFRAGYFERQSPASAQSPPAGSPDGEPELKNED